MSEQGLSIECFLLELAGEGRLDSQGQFTLALAQAREKLAKFLLKSPQDYLLKLIQAGVAAGAQRLELKTGSNRVLFRMLGVHYPSRDLANILDALLHTNSDSRALRHLAIATHSAVQIRPTGISLATWDGRSGEKHHWDAKGRTSQPWRPGKGDQASVQVEIQRTGSEVLEQLTHLMGQRDLLSMLVGSRRGFDADAMFVLKRASWCPIPLSLNGRWLPKPEVDVVSGQALQWKEREGDDVGIRCYEPNRITWPWTCNYQAPRSAVMRFYGPKGVSWIYDGVSVGKSKFRRDSWMTASAANCNLDLTGLQVIHDEALAQRRQSLEEWVGKNCFSRS